MKFKSSLVLFTVTSLCVLAPVVRADSNAVSVLKDSVGERSLECQIQESGKYRPAPPVVELKTMNSTQDGNEVIFATASYDDAKYSVNGDKVENGTLVIAMGNDIDGPHSEDKLEIPLTELNLLKTNPNSTVAGSDHYSEDEDGTSLVLKMSCELE